MKFTPTDITYQAVIGSVRGILNLGVFVVFFLVSFSIIAVQLYGGRLDPGSRASFDNFSRAFLALFQVGLCLNITRSNAVFFSFYFLPYVEYSHFM